tara:strand:+ start:145 stop:888 length:744 start_codon:yes stop_codon:yes gene_type:complete
MEVSFPEPRAYSALNNWLADIRRAESYALPSHYDIIIDSPAGGDARKVSLRCESIDLPGRSLNTATDSNMYGVAPEIVDSILFGGTITMTIQASGDLQERVFFEAWQERAWDRRTWNAMYYKDYIKDIEIYIYNQKNVRMYGIKLFECYPKDIAASPLSSDRAGDIIKIGVTMQYRYWETLDITRAVPHGPTHDADPYVGGVERMIAANNPAVVNKLGGGGSMRGGPPQRQGTRPEPDYSMPSDNQA